jgi:hypothetical protein
MGKSNGQYQHHNHNFENRTWPAPGVYTPEQIQAPFADDICADCGGGGADLRRWRDGKPIHTVCPQKPEHDQGRDSGDEHEHCDRRKPQTIDDLREERRQKASLLTQIREMRADLSRAQRCLEAVKRSLDDLEEAVGPR